MKKRNKNNVTMTLHARGRITSRLGEMSNRDAELLMRKAWSKGIKRRMEGLPSIVGKFLKHEEEKWASHRYCTILNGNLFIFDKRRKKLLTVIKVVDKEVLRWYNIYIKNIGGR